MLCNSKFFTLANVTGHTPVLKWILGLVVIATGAAIAIPLGRYADADDSPGGMVIAFLIFVAGVVFAMRIVNPRPDSGKPGSY